MKLALVVAIAENRVIGADGGLAWRISDDLKWFKKVTLRKPIIMGRKTFESIGKPLPERDNIVVTRSHSFDPGGVFVVRNIEASLTLAKQCADERGAEEICVIGGGEIYAQTIDLADRIYLTRVDAQIKGDTYFPEFDADGWLESPQGACVKNDRNSHSCRFFILNRRAE